MCLVNLRQTRIIFAVLPLSITSYNYKTTSSEIVMHWRKSSPEQRRWRRGVGAIRAPIEVFKAEGKKAMNNAINQRLLSSIRRQLQLHLQFQRNMCILHHHRNQPRYGPTETLKRKIKELEKNKNSSNIKRDQEFLVDVPESNSYLDTATMPMILTAVGIALFAKLLMMVKPIFFFYMYINFIAPILCLRFWVAYVVFANCLQWSCSLFVFM